MRRSARPFVLAAILFCGGLLPLVAYGVVLLHGIETTALSETSGPAVVLAGPLVVIVSTLAVVAMMLGSSLAIATALRRRRGRTN